MAETLLRREVEAAEQLTNQGFGGFCPVEVVQRRKRGSRRMVAEHVPMFRSYVFVSFDPAVSAWASIFHTRGVRRLIIADGRPVPVRRGAVELLLAHAAAGQVMPALPDDLLGKRLGIDLGLGKVVHGLCTMSEAARVGVLMTWLGAERQVVVPRDRVVEAAEAAALA